ncbi:tigger transposable element-derived protein 6-like [Rhizophagus irregularis DAOM 181602=DAOM 197198]|nr:tigger transposable element-derived protein 6-like [Rhizophagus irregularis DAOM 181602=DAOM 197198]
MPPDKKGKRKVAEGTSKKKSLSFAEKKELCEQINRAGEANSAPLETLEEECKILQEIIEQYDPCDVYNVDETGKNRTIKTLSDHYISGTKKLKNRITVVLICNANADNAPTHLLDETIQLSNIKVYFLPPNTTAHLQPLDAGIINSFKAQYRKLLIANRIEIITLELQEMIDKLNLQDPITAERFIHIDDEIPIELLFDEEIIAAIISRPENDDIEEDDELETNISSISNKEALKLKTLNALKSKINKQIQDNIKQTTLDSFMQC